MSQLAFFTHVHFRKMQADVDQRAMYLQSVKSPLNPRHLVPRPPPRPMRREDIYSQFPQDSELVTKFYYCFTKNIKVTFEFTIVENTMQTYNIFFYILNEFTSSISTVLTVQCEVFKSLSDPSSNQPGMDLTSVPFSTDLCGNLSHTSSLLH